MFRPARNPASTRRAGYSVLALAFAFVCSSCGSGPSDAEPSTSAPAATPVQLLYVITGGTIATYTVDPASLTITANSSAVALVPAQLLQFVPSPNDHFLYILWADQRGNQHLSVFGTTYQGVPSGAATQTLGAAGLSQFNIHPSGKFVYMLQVNAIGAEYASEIRLFTANTKTGELSEYARAQGSYGPSGYWPAFLYGFSASGTQLYDMSTNLAATTGTAVFRQRSVNLRAGILGPDVELYDTHASDSVALGSELIIDANLSSSEPEGNYVNVFPNPPEPDKPLIHCTSEMLDACGTASNVELDPSGRYLLLTDPATQSVRVAFIDLGAKQLIDTGGSFPMPAETPGFSFSPSGTLIFAILASDSSVHAYAFDRASGSITAGMFSLPVPPGAGIAPAERP